MKYRKWGKQCKFLKIKWTSSGWSVHFHQYGFLGWRKERRSRKLFIGMLLLSQQLTFLSQTDLKRQIFKHFSVFTVTVNLCHITNPEISLQSLILQLKTSQRGRFYFWKNTLHSVYFILSHLICLSEHHETQQ